MGAADYAAVKHAVAVLRRAAILGAIFMLPAALYTSWFVRVFLHANSLVQAYGFGNAPREQVFESLPGTGWVPDLSFLAAALCFLYGAGLARRVLDDMGVRGLVWSAKWLTLSMVIPFVNLYRPWVGLGEVDRSLRDMTSPTVDPGTRTFANGFSYRTAAILAAYLALVIGGSVINAGMEAMARDVSPATMASHVQRGIALSLSLVALQCVWVAASVSFLCKQSSRLETIYRREVGAAG